VAFFVSGGPNLFGSEYAFDSTGFESTQVIARYALDHPTTPGTTQEATAKFALTLIRANLEYLLKTLRVNFRYPHYVFNWTGANRYRLMKEYYPADYARLKQYVAAGRWFPAARRWRRGDGNLPSAEGIFRQVLLLIARTKRIRHPSVLASSYASSPVAQRCASTCAVTVAAEMTGNQFE
jgi:hypothetical protein